MQNRKVTRIHTKKAATLRPRMGSLVVHGSPAPRDDGLVRGRPLEVERRHDDERHEDEAGDDGGRHKRVVVVPASAAHGAVVVGIVMASAGRQRYFCNDFQDSVNRGAIKTFKTNAPARPACLSEECKSMRRTLTG